MREFARTIFLLFLLHTTVAFSQDSIYTRQLIRDLTAPDMHGRGYVKKGDKRAARYIAKVFKKEGLDPAGSKGYFQSFSFPVNTFPGKLALSINGHMLRPGVDFIIDPKCPRFEGKCSILIARGDPGSIRPDKVKGQWILLDSTDIQNNLDESRYASWLKLSEHSVGRIRIEREKLTWSVGRKVDPIPSITLLKKSLPSDPQEIAISINQHFREKHLTQNVIGLIPGKLQKDSFIFITAHYDHLGRMGYSTYFPGANDNASGVSMLVNLARHYVANPPDYTIVFIAFAGEEAGLLGSRHYTENPTVPLRRIRFLLNLDLMGTGDEGVMIVNATEFPNEFSKLDSLNKVHGFLSTVGKRGKAASSDHYWFTEAGVPGFFCYTMGGIKAYHDVYDRAETLPLTRYSECHRLFVRFLDILQSGD